MGCSTLHRTSDGGNVDYSAIVLFEHVRYHFLAEQECAMNVNFHYSFKVIQLYFVGFEVCFASDASCLH